MPYLFTKWQNFLGPNSFTRTRFSSIYRCFLCFKFILFFLLIYNRVVDKMKVVYPFYESVIIKKPKKVNV